MKLIWQSGVSFVSEESEISKRTVESWVNGISKPSLVNAQKALNAIGYELLIFEMDEPFEEVDI